MCQIDVREGIKNILSIFGLFKILDRREGSIFCSPPVNDEIILYRLKIFSLPKIDEIDLR